LPMGVSAQSRRPMSLMVLSTMAFLSACDIPSGNRGFAEFTHGLSHRQSSYQVIRSCHVCLQTSHRSCSSSLGNSNSDQPLTHTILRQASLEKINTGNGELLFFSQLHHRRGLSSSHSRESHLSGFSSSPICLQSPQASLSL
jgi:hypothetical protein